ncbi:hypothetical protein [Sabulicella rubraurantiaca]|uniref:hypothetical protein n=1 Tax=Sabulicella rubraurantiaca TaxID=2811429 RepID=UPI001A97AD69|nr:hypothetical protein [Sabulicella rubraurantiaca]
MKLRPFLLAAFGLGLLGANPAFAQGETLRLCIVNNTNVSLQADFRFQPPRPGQDVATGWTRNVVQDAIAAGQQRCLNVVPGSRAALSVSALLPTGPSRVCRREWTQFSGNQSYTARGNAGGITCIESWS